MLPTRPALVILTLVLLTAAAEAKPAWEIAFSKQPLSAADAETYCASLGAGWRLPMRAELESLGIDDAGKPSKGAPKLPPKGYLWSGEGVSDSRAGQHWILNRSNGRVFNGDGYEGYAKCVKGQKPSAVEHALPPGYMFLGPAEAKLTVPVAVQLDYIWHNKARALVEKMLATHPVRFEIHAFTISKEYVPIMRAACAAGRQNKLVAFEAKLAENRVGMSTPTSRLRELAVDVGVDPAAYDKAIRTTCRELVDADARAFKGKVDGAPTFFVGDRKVTGADPDKLDAAIVEALGATP